MAVKVVTRDRGAAAMLKRLINKGALSVGILGADGDAQHDKSDLTVAEIGAIHEFGLGTAPRRSFLADWADEKRDEVGKIAIAGGRALLRGEFGPVEFLEQLGAWCVGSIQERMSGFIPPPLAPATIQRKGSSIPLIDTGQLRSSITYRVDAVETNDGAVAILERVGAPAGAAND